MRPGRSKITDVARLAGVSVASVSRVLNETDPVADATRSKVLKAVADLDFRIDLRARAHSRQKSETLGIVVADVSNPFTAQVLKAIDIVTRENGYALMLSDSGEDVERERKNLEAMVAQRIEGIIYLPVTLSGRSLRGLISQDIPIVCLDRYVEDVPTDAVIMDNERAGALAAGALVDAGHSRIGVIVAGETTVGRDRLRGFEHELERLGAPLNRAWLRVGDLSLASGREHTLSLCAGLDGPTAIFVQNYPMALGALLAFREIGRRVPDDVSVISFDDPSWAPLVEPALTTIRQPTYELGSAAARMLIDRVARRYVAGPRRIVVEPSLVIRDSIAPPIERALEPLP
jgi:DNA-binding LacI/PurR family transcriptional regulator